jgi:hypothetical protein
VSHDSSKKAKFECHERCHMSGAVYKTYDAMRAMAESAYTGTHGDGTPKRKRDPNEPLVFCGKIRPTLANHTNTSITQLYEHIDILLKDGWLYEAEPLVEGAKRERNAKGHLMPVVYYVLTHAEWLAIGKGERKCPPYRYKPDGEREEKGSQPVDFQMAELVKHAAGRAALFAARAAGKLPGKTWAEIMENLRKHPENLPIKKRADEKHAKDALARISGHGR